MKLPTSFRALLLAGGLAMTTIPAYAADDATVNDIDVSVEVEGVEGSNALSYYPGLEADLQKAVASRVPVSDDPNGYDVKVTIQKISLDGDTILPDSAEFNEMEGVVFYSSPLTNEAPQSFTIQIAAVSGDKVLPPGYIAVSPSTEDFYVAMVEAFANSVGEKLPEHMRDSASK